MKPILVSALLFISLHSHSRTLLDTLIVEGKDQAQLMSRCEGILKFGRIAVNEARSLMSETLHYKQSYNRITNLRDGLVSELRALGRTSSGNLQAECSFYFEEE